MRRRIPTYPLPVLLVVNLFLFLVLPAAASARSLRTTPFATRGMMETRPLLSQDDIFRADPLPATMRVLAIRVDFAPDTLSTTTGDGGFFYELPEDVDAEDWLVDPPPHDSSYFADQLLALRNYYSKFSRGQLTLTGFDNDGPNSGGDIYPAGEQAAYHIDYPIWHVNYGDGDNDRLNQTLTQLFVDAWSAANEDPALNIANYDIFIIFHAGAGNEFDTGFDTTPHDIPSVVIGPTDLNDFVGLPNGVPMANGYITRGAILPETQRQEDVDVGMLGTVCAQVGFLLGMPHMYNTENGDPGIGLLGLMDRGFGGYFGIAPTPPSAWMRAYMGWDPVTTISEGEIRVGALHLPDQAFVDDPTLNRLVRVPINENEYYLVEARRRDPDEDSLTVAIDRDGDRLLLHDDYTIELDPNNTGEMTAPVLIEDHDFDLPASGMLIWHIDESVIRANIAADQVQNDRNHRGVDLEEADGTEDIGEEYEFLQPGDGAEYGVREDAWYRGNELWQESNNNANSVRFGTNTYPSTYSNSGGATHIEFADFSAIGDTMTALVGNDWKVEGFPATVGTAADSGYQMLTADLDGDGSRDLVVYNAAGEFRGYKADGTILGGPEAFYTLPDPVSTFRVAAGKVARYGEDGDLRDWLVVATDNRILYLQYEPSVGLATEQVVIPVDAQNFIDVTLMLPYDAAGGGVNLSRLMVAALAYEESVGLRLLVVRHYQTYEIEYYDLANIDPAFANANQAWLTSYMRFVSDYDEPFGVQLFIVGNNGSAAYYNILENFGERLFAMAPVEGLQNGETIGRPIGLNNTNTVAALTSLGRLVQWHPPQLMLSSMVAPTPESIERPGSVLVPFDIDGDGFEEVTMVSGNEIVGYTGNGLIAESTPVQFPPHMGQPGGYPSIVTRLDLNRNPYYITYSQVSATEASIGALDFQTRRTVRGFPLDFNYKAGQPMPDLFVDHMAEDTSPYLAILSQPYDGDPARLTVYRLPFDSRTTHPVWTGQNGNSSNSRYYWLRSDSNSWPDEIGADVSKAYAWPNPVYDDLVHFRFTGTQPVTAEVQVYDLVGRKVADMTKSLGVSFTGEQELSLDVSNWPSGVYVARLAVNDGKYKMIRFAVVQ